MKAIISAAALALLCAAPAMAGEQAGQQATEIVPPKPASDYLVHPKGAFYAYWGETPEEVTKKLAPSWLGLTPQPNRQMPVYDQVPLLSFVYTYGDFTYNVDAHFGPDTNGLSVVSLSSQDVAACDALEARLITQLGEGDPITETTSDEYGEYVNRTRVWVDEAQASNLYAYAFLPKNSEVGDYCLTTILDANGGMF